VESYRTEEEQVEALRNWWKENGRSTIVGIVLALGLGFGWQAWQQSREQAAENASLLYQQMLEQLGAQLSPGEAANDSDKAKEIAEQIKEAYRGSVYAQFAALHLARLAVNEGRLEAAEQELRWVLSMASSGDDVHQLAQLRLARVVAAQGDPEGALAMLEGARTELVASYALTRGDILMAQGREDDARIAYETAVAALEAESPVPPGLQEKLQYLNARRAESGN
jgi:predicted negative regulator of RcsB-dependent stress response